MHFFHRPVFSFIFYLCYFYLATVGVRARVMGVRTGKSALLQINASANVELPPESILSSQLWFSGVAPAASS